MIRVLVAASLLTVGLASAERQEAMPADLENVGIEEHLSDQLPLDAVFTDDKGNEVRFGDYFVDGRPVILNLGYYGCPMLCGLVGEGLLGGMKPLGWTPGDEYEVVTLSIDPTETANLAKLKKQAYLEDFGRAEAADGWHFLVGADDQIRSITDAAGWNYEWNEERQEYAHAACVIMLTPEGKVSRYLYGIEYNPKDIRLGLLEASEGKVGSPFDKILMFCYQYDSSQGRYAPAAKNMMRAGGAFTVVGLGAVLAVFWRRDAKRKMIA